MWENSDKHGKKCEKVGKLKLKLIYLIFRAKNVYIKFSESVEIY